MVQESWSAYPKKEDTESAFGHYAQVSIAKEEGLQEYIDKITKAHKEKELKKSMRAREIPRVGPNGRNIGMMESMMEIGRDRWGGSLSKELSELRDIQSQLQLAKNQRGKRAYERFRGLCEDMGSVLIKKSLSIVA